MKAALPFRYGELKLVLDFLAIQFAVWRTCGGCTEGFRGYRIQPDLQSGVAKNFLCKFIPRTNTLIAVVVKSLNAGAFIGEKLVSNRQNDLSQVPGIGWTAVLVADDLKRMPLASEAEHGLYKIPAMAAV